MDFILPNDKLIIHNHKIYYGNNLTSLLIDNGYNNLIEQKLSYSLDVNFTQSNQFPIQQTIGTIPFDTTNILYYSFSISSNVTISLDSAYYSTTTVTTTVRFSNEYTLSYGRSYIDSEQTSGLIATPETYNIALRQNNAFNTLYINNSQSLTSNTMSVIKNPTIEIYQIVDSSSSGVRQCTNSGKLYCNIFCISVT